MARKAQKRHQQAVHMGLGEAIQRLMQVEFIYRMGAGQVPEKLLEERNMLLEALNVIPVEVGFDCNSDAVPDDVGIFAQAVATSCCRILPLDTSRKVEEPVKAPKASSSRRKEVADGGPPPPATKSPEAVVAEAVPAVVEAAPVPVVEQPKKKRGALSRLFKKED